VQRIKASNIFLINRNVGSFGKQNQTFKKVHQIISKMKKIKKIYIGGGWPNDCSMYFELQSKKGFNIKIIVYSTTQPCY
jgi:hypothetical protein